MRHTSHLGSVIIGIVAVAVLSIAAWGDLTLTLTLTEMDPHIGQALGLRVVDTATGGEISRLTVEEIPGSTLELSLSGLMKGASYRIDLYADANGNGIYDAPPDDHAWRIELPEVQMDGALTFAHNASFVDIDWPPAADGVIVEGEYRHSMVDRGTGIEVYWQNDGETIYVGLIGPGTGWVAIGFDPERRMMGANIIIAAVDDEGELSIEDHFGTTQTAHMLDATSDILQAAGIEEEGQTLVEFAYPLRTTDHGDMPLTPGTEIAIILAYHRTLDSLTMRHTSRSTVFIQLD